MLADEAKLHAFRDVLEGVLLGTDDADLDAGLPDLGMQRADAISSDAPTRLSLQPSLGATRPGGPNARRD